MTKAQLIEKFIRSDKGHKRNSLESIVHETRYFTTKEKFNEWFDTFKADLWEDDATKVNVVEGIYVKTEEIKMDNIEKPERLKLYASFRTGISYKYAV